MIEIYVGLTLLGLGYIINQNRPVKSNPVKQLNTQEMSSATNVYDSNFTQTAKKIEAKLANDKFRNAVQPSTHSTNKIVPPSMISKSMPKDKIVSELSGLEVDNFSHNNMTPFFKGSLKHTRLDAPSHKLENFTGMQTYYQPKKEVDTFFKPEKNVGTGLGGNKPAADFLQSRVDAPRVKNNVLPFEQVRVGPGVNRGFSADPTGGYQQFDARDYAIPRGTDEIRAANKPKVTYAGRTVDGQKGSVPANVGCVNKNRTETFYQNDPKRYFKTTGARFKEKMHPEVEAKYTARQDVSTKSYTGGAYKGKGDQQRPETRAPHKTQFGAFGITNASLTHRPNQKQDDYGKGSVLIYDNERSITTTRTYQGNVTSIIKGLTAPIEDLIKVSKKEYTVEAPREYGNFSGTHKKATVHDPNAVARTTIKETLLQDAETLNLKGPTKITVYDPNAVARTTGKETLLQPSETLNYRGPSKGSVHDPNAVMRTTIKETLLHDAQPVNVKGDRSMGIVYDPNNVPLPTVRNTVEPIETTRNMGTSGGRQAGKVYDPNDKLRTTMKETTADAPRDFGNADRAENFTGAYQGEVYDVPETQRHIISANSEYQGNPNQQSGNAYEVVQEDFVPRETQKEHTTNNEYYGSAGDKTTHKPMSYDDAYNATMDSLKEELEQSRDPTLSGVKIFGSHEDVVMNTRKIECDQITTRTVNNGDKVVNVPLDPHESVTMTRQRNDYDNEDRLDIDILEAFKNNDFTQPLDSWT